MIYTKYLGRFGNILFQYSFARILSKLANTEIVEYQTHNNISHQEYIKGIVDFKKYHKSNNYSSTGEALTHSPNNQEVITYKNEKIIIPNGDISTIVEIAQNRDILLNSYFQNFSYFKQHREWLKENIKIADIGYFKSSDLVVHIRLGDYLNPKFNKYFGYPISAISNVLEGIEFKNFIIVTDSPKDAQVLGISDAFKCRIISESKLYDFRTMLESKRILLTPSTFSWWAAFLGNHEEIYFPVGLGAWKNTPEINMTGSNIKYFNSDGVVFD